MKTKTTTSKEATNQACKSGNSPPGLRGPVFEADRLRDLFAHARESRIKSLLVVAANAGRLLACPVADAAMVIPLGTYEVGDRVLKRPEVVSEAEAIAEVKAAQHRSNLRHDAAVEFVVLGVNCDELSLIPTHFLPLMVALRARLERQAGVGHSQGGAEARAGALCRGDEPMKPSDSDLVARAIRAYCRRFGGEAPQPSSETSGVEDGYVVLRNCNGVLSRYRVMARGRLRLVTAGETP